MDRDSPVFHVFVDATLAAAATHPLGRYGESAVGVVIFASTGRVVHEEARLAGKQTNNRGEMWAIHAGLAAALANVQTPNKVYIVIHTDSEIAYRGLVHDELRNPALTAVRDSIRALERGFRSVEYNHVRRESKGIRRAEAVAKKALAKKLNRKLTRRGTKTHRPPLEGTMKNPFLGQF